jgi:thermitase
MKKRGLRSKIFIGLLLLLFLPWLLLLRPGHTYSQTEPNGIEYVVKLNTPAGDSTDKISVRTQQVPSVKAQSLPVSLEKNLKPLGLQQARPVGRRGGGYRILSSKTSIGASLGKPYYLLNFSADADRNKIENALKDSPEVALHSENLIYHKAAFVPNDPKYPQQWALERIQAPQAWDLETGSSSTKIAIIDTGCDLNHPDLEVNINHSLSYDFVKDDFEPWDDSVDSHGTHVAGIIAAVGNNGQGVAGLNWKAELIIYKALDNEGLGTLDKLIAAIDEAIDNEVDIINMSWGTDEHSPILEDVLQEAADAEVVLVAAAGNEGELLYPAKYPMVLGVAGTGKAETDPRWSAELDGTEFESAYGPEIDVSAPAEDILSTTKSGSYASLSGTSMSAGFVSGEAGLVLSQKHSLSRSDVYKIIKENVDPLDTQPGKPIGSGRINLFKAVEAASNFIPEPTPSPSPTPPSEVPEDEAWIEGVVEGEEGGEIWACTDDAKVCPDGSTVGRTGPDCQFAPCPGETAGITKAKKGSLRTQDAGRKPLAGIKVVARAVRDEDWPPIDYETILDETIVYETIVLEPSDEYWYGEDILAEAVTDEEGRYKLVITEDSLEELDIEPVDGRYIIQVTAGDDREIIPWSRPPYYGDEEILLLSVGMKKVSSDNSQGARFCPPRRPFWPPGYNRRGGYLAQTKEIEIELGQKFNLDFVLELIPETEPPEPPEPPETPNGGGGCGGGGQAGENGRENYNSGASP